MVEMFIAVFIVVNIESGEEVGDMRSPEPMTIADCERVLEHDAPSLAKVLQAHGFDLKLPGTCEPVGEPA